MLPKEIEQIALLTVAGLKRRKIGGGKVKITAELLDEIRKELPPMSKEAVPENYLCLRTIQFMIDPVFGPAKLKTSRGGKSSR